MQPAARENTLTPRRTPAATVPRDIFVWADYFRVRNVLQENFLIKRVLVSVQDVHLGRPRVLKEQFLVQNAILDSTVRLEVYLPVLNADLDLSLAQQERNHAFVVQPLLDTEQLRVPKHVKQGPSPLRSEGPATAVRRDLIHLGGLRPVHSVNLERMLLAAK